MTDTAISPPATLAMLLHHLGVLPEGHLPQLRKWHPLLPDMPQLGLTSTETLAALEEHLALSQGIFRVEDTELIRTFLLATRAPGAWRLVLRQGDDCEETTVPVVICKDGAHAALGYLEDDAVLWNGESYLTDGKERRYLGEGELVYLGPTPVLRKYPIASREPEVGA